MTGRLPSRLDHDRLRHSLSGGDRRSIAQSHAARALVCAKPALVRELVALTGDSDDLVAMRAADLLEKLAHDHRDWLEPHRRVWIGALADREGWEIQLQVVRALPLFEWSPRDMRRVREILVKAARHPRLFVRAWAVDGLATLAGRDRTLLPLVRRHLREFERSGRGALEARAKRIRQRLSILKQPTAWKRNPP